jgi:putative tricarboxylic transport membrane protein
MTLAGKSALPSALGAIQIPAPSRKRGLMLSKVSTPDFKSGLFFLLLSAIIGVFSFKIGVGTLSKPGPGFVPFGAALLLMVLSFLSILLVLGGKSESNWEMEVKWRNFLSVMGAMAVYGFLLNRIGFIFSTFLFVTFLIKFIGPRDWKKAVAAGAITSACSYLLFESLLKSQLPRTFLGYF